MKYMTSFLFTNRYVHIRLFTYVSMWRWIDLYIYYLTISRITHTLFIITVIIVNISDLQIYLSKFVKHININK